MRDNEDFLQFITFLKYSLANSDAVLWAYALMNNHYHIILYATSEELRACMQRLNRLYSKYHNRRYSLVGHAFEGPYRAFRLDPSLILQCLAYVFMNPVSAFVVKDPRDYSWSCYRQYLGLPGSPMEGDVKSLMHVLDVDTRTAWRRFHLAMECEARRPKKAFSDGLTMTALHAQQFEWVLDTARKRQEHLAGENPDWVAMYWARRQGVVPRAMAKVLGTSSRAVSDVLYCLSKRLKKEPGLEAILLPP